MEDLAERTIDHAMKLGADFADLRIESESGTSIVVMDGKTRITSSQTEAGCGVRAFVKGAWGFAATTMLTRASLESAAESAVGMARAACANTKVKFDIVPSKALRTKETYRCREFP